MEFDKNEVIEIDIDDLAVDTCNIRGDRWDRDDELIESIRFNGIIEPLIVRPADESTGVKYAIVCGSRRYHASIEAGLSKVPCIIRHLDDIEATALSILENKHQKEIPTWTYALKIGNLFDMLEGEKDEEGTINFISEKTGISKNSIKDFVEIFNLPPEVFILMKKPDERTEAEMELFKKYNIEELSKPLSKSKAVLISKELKSFPIEKQIEVARTISLRSDKDAKEIVRLVRTYPKEPMEKILEKHFSIPKGARWYFYFDSSIVSAVDEACIRKKLDRKTLIVEYVKEGLKKEGYI